jgi:hypothetical protein
LQQLPKVRKSLWDICSNCGKSEKVSEAIAAVAANKKNSPGRLPQLRQVEKSLWDICSTCCKSEKVSEAIAAAAAIKKISPGRLPQLRQAGKLLRRAFVVITRQENPPRRGLL